MAKAPSSPVSLKPGTSPKLAEILQNYRGFEDCYDEAVNQPGEVRSAWQPLFEQLGRSTVADIQHRSARAQRQVETDGVVFNPHDTGDVSRPWKLDSIPLVIPQQEWNRVAQGLEQRAQLTDLLLLDLLGPQTLLHEKVVPPELLFANPNYFPAYHGLVQHPKQHVQIYAADLARGPSGRWWVTADRTRAPSGLGFALENRLITSRMMPTAFARGNVLRLASFFKGLKNTLSDMAERFRDNPRIAIWSKGPESKSYFEDAFLARYLGYTLVESDDLAVRGNRVMLKTLGALLPVEVLLRRVEDQNCDPAELQSQRQYGVSGLLEAVRSSNVRIANSLGSSYAESPMLFSYLPGICQHFLNQDLILPSVATWWCGRQSGLSHVLENLDRLIIRGAFRLKHDMPLRPASMSAAAKAELVASIKAAPHRYVGQEQFAYSTTPVWENDKLQPWYLAIRGFSAATVGGGYTTLPGALARVSKDPHVLSQDMTSGEKSQDVWIVSDEKVPLVSLLPKPARQMKLQRSGADLPSRVAENLYWLGRNLERSEQSARLIRLALLRATSEDAFGEGLQRLIELCDAAGQLPAADKMSPDQPLAHRLIRGAFDSSQVSSLRCVVQSSQQTAAKVRDRIALDSYRIITNLSEVIGQDFPSDADEAALELLQVLDSAVESLSAISGLASESMTRTLGWRFLDLGRRIERACQTVASLSVLLGGKLDDQTMVLEDILQLQDSFMTYRNRYLGNLELSAVLDLVVIDESNPRSLASQLGIIHQHVEELPRDSSMAVLTIEQRTALSLYNWVRLADAFELAQVGPSAEYTSLNRLLGRMSDKLPTLSDALSARFLIHTGAFQRHFAREHDPIAVRNAARRWRSSGSGEVQS